MANRMHYLLTDQLSLFQKQRSSVKCTLMSADPVQTREADRRNCLVSSKSTHWKELSYVQQCPLIEANPWQTKPKTFPELAVFILVKKK